MTNEKMKRKLRLVTGMAIATVVTAIILFFLNGPQGEKIQTSQTLVQTIGLQVENFKKACGFYPSSSQGLKALVTQPEGEPACADWRGPYSTEEFVDSWGHALFYSSDTKVFDLRSFGKDGKIGGTENDADLVFTAHREP